MKTPRRRVSRPERNAERAIRLARMVELAEQIFGDTAKAHRWLRKPKRALGDVTPLASLATEAGTRRVEQMLYRIDSGVLS
jgi:putative toxin-antitoxin system antitoxin component (TIGR02293 family)